MNANVGGIDRVVRIVVGVVLLVVGITAKATLGVIAAWVAIIMGVVALMTGAVKCCGLYKLFGISTCPVKIAEEDEATPAESATE
jgi:hypothetical protein